MQEITAMSNVVKAFPYFSPMVFIILGLGFRSLIHLELIFVHGVRKGSVFSIPLNKCAKIHLTKSIAI